MKQIKTFRIKLNIEDRIMDWCWGKGNWNKDSLAHKFWKRQVCKKNKSVIWWKKNWRRFYGKD